jgi:hypothetical protein
MEVSFEYPFTVESGGLIKLIRGKEIKIRERDECMVTDRSAKQNNQPIPRSHSAYKAMMAPSVAMALNRLTWALMIKYQAITQSVYSLRQ